MRSDSVLVLAHVSAIINVSAVRIQHTNIRVINVQLLNFENREERDNNTELKNSVINTEKKFYKPTVKHQKFTDETTRENMVIQTMQKNSVIGSKYD